MNDHKFSDCKWCVHTGFGTRIKECRTCQHGENFEEKISDTVEMMRLEEFDLLGLDHDSGC